MLVSQRQPFSKTYRGVLTHPVRGPSNLVQQTRSRRGVHEVATAARDHAGNQVSRSVDVRHHVDIPAHLPFLVRRVEIHPHPDAGIRTKEIDRANATFGGLNDLADVRFDRNIGLEAKASDFGGRRFCALAVEINRNHGTSAFGGKAANECPPDATGRPGHNDDLILDLHTYPSPFSITHETCEPWPRDGQSAVEDKSLRGVENRSAKAAPARSRSPRRSRGSPRFIWVSIG